MKSRLLVLLLLITSTIAANTKISQVEVKVGSTEIEESQERELTDRTLTVVSKTVKISGKSFKCAISISHGCVTTLTTNVKCSGKPKSLGSIRFTKDGYTFQVDFQTPSKVIKTQLLGVPCPKCSCKSKLCSPPCPTKPSKPSQEETETPQTTTEAKKPTMTENTFSTTTIGETTKKHSTDTTTEAKKPVTTTTDKTTTTENILSTTTKEQTTKKTSTDTTTDVTTKEQTTQKTSTDTTTKEQTTKKTSDTPTTERVKETTESITTTDDQETSGSPTPSFHHRGQPGGFDEGCTCVPNFILFFSQHFLMQKDYQGNGFIEACYCIEEEVYTMQTIL